MPNSKKPKVDPYLCTPEDRYCSRESLRSLRTPPNTELMARLGECGIKCEGRSPHYLKKYGYCGILGAVEDAASKKALDSAMKDFPYTHVVSINATVDAGTRAGIKVFDQGQDPAEVLGIIVESELNE